MTWEFFVRKVNHCLVCVGHEHSWVCYLVERLGQVPTAHKLEPDIVKHCNLKTFSVVKCSGTMLFKLIGRKEKSHIIQTPMTTGSMYRQHIQQYHLRKSLKHASSEI